MDSDAINQTVGRFANYLFQDNATDMAVTLKGMDDGNVRVDSLDQQEGVNSSERAFNQSETDLEGHFTSKPAIVSLSLLFSVIVFVGVCGNIMVIYSILSDRNMRRSVTNCFILNLAVADLLIMLLGVPEIVQFILDRGWLLGRVLCKVNRYILVTSLYASITTLMGVCTER